MFCMPARSVKVRKGYQFQMLVIVTAASAVPGMPNQLVAQLANPTPRKTSFSRPYWSW